MKQADSRFQKCINRLRQGINLISSSCLLLVLFFFRFSEWDAWVSRIQPLLSFQKGRNTTHNLLHLDWSNQSLRKIYFQCFCLFPAIVSALIASMHLLNGLELLEVSIRFCLGSLSGIFLSCFFCLDSSLIAGVNTGLRYGTSMGFFSSLLITSLGNTESVFIDLLIIGLSIGFVERACISLKEDWLENGSPMIKIGLAMSIPFSIVLGTSGFLNAAYSNPVQASFFLFINCIFAFLASMACYLIFVALGIIAGIVRPHFFAWLLSPWNWILFQYDDFSSFQEKLVDRRDASFHELHSLNDLSKEATFSRIKDSGSLIRFNSVFWDELQPAGNASKKHILWLLEKRPNLGIDVVNYLGNGIQKDLMAPIRLEYEARILESCRDIESIREVHLKIKPGSRIIRIFKYISEDVDAALKQKRLFGQLNFLRKTLDRLEDVEVNLSLGTQSHSGRLNPVARNWQRVLEGTVTRLNSKYEDSQEIDNPYIFGSPLDDKQLTFDGRVDIIVRLEQIILDFRRPTLLLYGQRRMGKTSLLLNLRNLLPKSIIPIFVDLQGSVSSARNEIGFLYNLSRGIITSGQRRSDLAFPSLSREIIATDPFTAFDEWLDQVEAILDNDTVLLTFDEFETLDAAFDKGNLDETAILGFLRNLIQHRPRFKILLAGSHTLSEFQRWSSYLINAQTIEISYLTEAETRKLIETPIPNFALRYDPDASDRTYALTRGHPALTQLLCAEIVNLKNEQDPSVRRQASLADINAAIPEALQSGSMFFADLEQNQITAQGTISGAAQLLRHLAAQGESIPSPDGTKPAATLSHSALTQHFAENIIPANPEANFDAALEICLRRDVIEAAEPRNRVFEPESLPPSQNLREKPGFSNNEPHYKFQVELIRRWFLQ